jgi:hypothetical protein
VGIFGGGCVDGTARPFRYARSLRQLPGFLVLTAQPLNILSVFRIQTFGNDGKKSNLHSLRN